MDDKESKRKKGDGGEVGRSNGSLDEKHIAKDGICFVPFPKSSTQTLENSICMYVYETHIILTSFQAKYNIGVVAVAPIYILN